MLRVGVTGGVACGKTIVGQMLARHGARLINADEIAHRLMEPGQPVYSEVVNRFGREIVQEDGRIDRKKLADVAFGAGRIQELNQIVHPAVIKHQEFAMNEIERDGHWVIAVVEAALLLEAGVGDHFDKLVVVTCSREQKIERYAQRHTLDRAAAEREVDRRMAALWPDERKAEAADYVIDNSGSLADLEDKVANLYGKLAVLALQPQPSRNPKHE